MTTTIYDKLISAEMVTDFDAFMAKAKTAKKIIEEVSNQTMIPVRDLLGRKRDHPTAYARQLCFYRMQRECNYSLPEIGRLFDRDYTTVLHGIRREEQRQKQEATLAQQKTILYIHDRPADTYSKEELIEFLRLLAAKYNELIYGGATRGNDLFGSIQPRGEGKQQ